MTAPQEKKIEKKRKKTSYYYTENIYITSHSPRYSLLIEHKE